MDVLGVIPARYGSTRLEAKLLQDICGKPLIQHTWENAKGARMLDELVIATDDERIKTVAEGFGAKVVMTSKDHVCGTDRVLEACFSVDTKIVLNIQGDEPLVCAKMVDILADSLLSDKDAYMSTLMKKIDDQNDINNPNVVKVVCDRNGYSLYFSRSVIPHPRNAGTADYYKHFGLYAYRKDFLFTFVGLKKSMLEISESLEQLRVLENGYKIKVVKINEDSIGVDTIEDLQRVRDIVSSRGKK